MKLRTLITGLLIAVVVAPVVATSGLFEDVSASHPYATEIGWVAGFDPPLFEGYEDGTFRPDELLTAAQLVKVVDRLHSAQGWTRGEVAALLFHGYHHLHPTTTAAVPMSSTTLVDEGRGFGLPPLPTWPITVHQPEAVVTERIVGDTLIVRATVPEWSDQQITAVYDLKNNSGDHRTHSAGLQTRPVDGGAFEIELTCSRFLTGKALDITLTNSGVSVSWFHAVDCTNLPPTGRRTFDQERSL